MSEFFFDEILFAQHHKNIEKNIEQESNFFSKKTWAEQCNEPRGVFKFR